MTPVTLQYIANIRLPTEKAHGAQIMKTCEALARAGAEVELVVAARHTTPEDPFTYYTVERLFTVRKLPVIDTVSLGRLGFWLESVSFSISAFVYSLLQHARTIYGRDELPLYLISFFKKNIVWESHTGRYNFLIKRLLKVCTLVAITHGLKDFYKEKYSGVKVIVVPDGIDLKAFAHPESKEAARARLGLPQDKKVVLYVGRLDGWKGTDTLLAAAKELPNDIVLAIIGGEAAQIAKLRMQYPNVMFLGSRPYRELADNEAAGDVLVLPNTAKDEISARFTSPMKLFSYMAAGKPIIASDLPSLREVLSDESAFFFTPDNPHALAQAIHTALSDMVRAQRFADRARAEVMHYTWDERARIILQTIARRS